MKNCISFYFFSDMEDFESTCEIESRGYELNFAAIVPPHTILLYGEHARWM